MHLRVMANDYDLFCLDIHRFSPLFHDLQLYREYVPVHLRDIVPLTEDMAGVDR